MQTCRKVSHPIYRRFDKVRVINPRVFVRCGYPLTIEDGREWVRNHDKRGQIPLLALDFGLVSKSSQFDDDYRLISDIQEAIARAWVRKQGFGGNERSIYTQERPEIMGKVYQVDDKCVVKTGTYRRGSSDPEDAEGPSLRNVKTHTILRVSTPMNSQDYLDFNYDSFEIEAVNVELFIPNT